MICKCENLVKDGDLCQKCGAHAKKNTKTSNYIAYIPLIPQIKMIFSSNYGKVIEYLTRERETGVITDIDDSIAYKNIKSKYPHSTVLSFTLNIDGANFHRSSKHSLWPTQLYQNYLPPSERYKTENILIVSLYYGTKKPNPFHLVSLLAQELENCEISIYNGNSIEQFIPSIVIASCDLPARAMLQSFKGPVGRSACPVCYHKGEPIANLKKSTTIRYVQTHDYVQFRTHDETIARANQIGVGDDSIDGVKGHSCMLLFDHFDIIDNYATDFMHGIALGVAKFIIEIWLGIRKIPDPQNGLKIKLKNAAERDCLNQRILKLKPTMQFKRKPRSIYEISTYKATEVLDFLIYYSRFSLMSLLPTKIVKHFELLSAATFMLCQKRINDDELNRASKMFDEFADNFELIYGKAAVTMNVHLLRHYGRMVRLCGPLWANALFGFETNIGALKNFVCGTTDVIQQICEKYAISKMFSTNFDEKIDTKQTAVYQPTIIQLTEDNAIVLSNANITFNDQGKFKIYRRLKSDGQTYTSISSRETRAADFFLQLNDGTLGTAEFYFEISGKMFVLLNKYQISYSHYHLKEVKKMNCTEIFRCTEIKTKVLYLHVAGIEYISNKMYGYFA